MTYIRSPGVFYTCLWDAEVYYPFEKAWQQMKKSVLGDLKNILKSWNNFLVLFLKLQVVQEPNKYVFVICEYKFWGEFYQYSNMELYKGESVAAWHDQDVLFT